MRTRNVIEEFLQQRRFAFIGVSRNKGEFSRKLFDEFVKRGYEPIPVNPNTTHVDGIRCYGSVKDVEPRVTSALLMIPHALMVEVLRQCADAGVTLVWIYGITGPRSISPEALRVCEEFGIGVVAGYCPYMFMPATALFHRVHGFLLKLTGEYPR